MTDYSFFERLKILFGLIFSSPFFLALIVIFILTTVVLIGYNKLKNKYLKYGVAFGYFLIAILILIKYGSSILNLSDSLINQIFSFIYFPNIIAYICMMIITTLLLIMTLVNNKLHLFIKSCNIITFVIIEILFVLSLDVIVSNNIDIYTETSVYSNETLMILIQTSTGVFCIWLLILFINFLVNFINNKINKKAVPQMEEEVNNKVNEVVVSTIVDEPILITDEEFNKSIKKRKKWNYKYFMKYIKDDKK